MSDKKLWDYHQNGNRTNLLVGYPRQDYIYKNVVNNIKKGGKILEIGFGDGYLLNKLSCSGYKVIGQDLSIENINITKKQWNNSSIEFIVGDDSGLINITDSSIDCFIASEVLEHMTDEQLLIAVNEIYRVLKQGGLAIVTVPANENLKSSECYCPNCGYIYHKWGHKQSWNISKIESCFDKFKICSITNRPFNNNNLNIFGLIEYYTKLALSFLKFSVTGNTFFIILKK